MSLGYPVFLVALAVCGVGGFLCLCLGRRGVAHGLGAATAVLASGMALVSGLDGMIHSAWSLSWAWPVPMGAFQLAMDPLSGFFVAVIAVVSLVASVYGYGYLKHDAKRKNLGLSWFWFNGLLVSMWLVVTASNAVLFLVAWECMSLTSFFLVIYEHERQEVVEAGWTYLVATHLGTACLLAMFVLLSGTQGSLDFESMAAATPTIAGWAFVLALVGFGTKAGLMPMHVWLPLAHPAAPSHVSAVMSGVMIKTGIYGLLRVLTLLGAPAVWWGWTLIAVGVISGILGVLLAMVQHDLKRLLAYHSVENIGIITLGLGLGVLGIGTGHLSWAILGFAGGLLHVFNHAIFKSLLFLGAGSIQHATGTLEIDRLGGLLKRMPVTGTTFLVGSAAIAGLPPLNGFVSEFLIYMGALSALVTSSGIHTAWAGVLIAGGLALIGGLAAACFAKAFSVIFLGEPRVTASSVHESPRSMTWPLAMLAAVCIAVGLLGPFVVQGIKPVMATLLAGQIDPVALDGTALPVRSLAWISLAAVGLLGLVGLLAGIRQRLLSQRTVRQAPTWDCGFTAPNARMQYTASSFVWPVVAWFHAFFRPQRHGCDPEGLFPIQASLHTDIKDCFLERGYRPLFALVARLAGMLRCIQQGRNQLYVLYIAITILVLFIWKMR